MPGGLSRKASPGNHSSPRRTREAREKHVQRDRAHYASREVGRDCRSSKCFFQESLVLVRRSQQDGNTIEGFTVFGQLHNAPRYLDTLHCLTRRGEIIQCVVQWTLGMRLNLEYGGSNTRRCCPTICLSGNCRLASKDRAEHSVGVFIVVKRARKYSWTSVYECFNEFRRVLIPNRGVKKK
jgi:hypothetical protein